MSFFFYLTGLPNHQHPALSQGGIVVIVYSWHNIDADILDEVVAGLVGR